MFILLVIPISRGIPFNTLSYYSSESLSMGTLVKIPLGRQTIPGIVFECTPLVEAKTSIKQATFSLKKIKSVIGLSTFGKAFVEGIRESSTRTLTPVGSLAEMFINELFFDQLTTFEEALDDTEEARRKNPITCYGIYSGRIDSYKRIIRGAFALKQSVILIAPSIRSVEYWHDALQKGITSHTVILHSKRTKRDQKNALTLIKNSSKPLFICATPQNAIIPRKDAKTIILEDESSPLYKSHDRFNTDLRIVIESISKAFGLQIVYGDTLPRFEKLYESNSIHLDRLFTPDKLVIVPTETYRSILPTEVIEMVRFCQKNKKNLFVYTNRKGIAPISRCTDCGTSVDCRTCGLPVVLRYKTTKGERERIFICTHCGDTLPTTHVCSHCASWNISPISIGSDSISEAVVSIAGEENVIKLEDDVTLDSKNSETLIEDLQKRKFFIIVGTQKLLPFIKSVDFVAIPFFDRILSTPSPFIVEETLRLIMQCNEKARDSLVICIKNTEFPITKLLATKKIQAIIDGDMEIRRSLKYPPFGTLLKISITVPASHKEALSQKISLFFKLEEITMLTPRRISPESMKILCVWIVQLENSYLNDFGEDLQLFLQDLRFPFSIEINPGRIS